MRPQLRRLSLGLALLVLVMPTANAGSRLYSLGVEGLVCQLCAFSVKRNLAALKGVEAVQIDYRTGQAVVSVADGATLVEAEARTAVETAGFKLRTFEERQSASPR